MTKGKSICNVLKTIRKQVADANEIKYEPRECHHEGECRGTCPACEAEVRYIEQQLNIRRQLGKAVAVVGISAGLAALSSCTSCSDNASNLEKGEMEQQSLMEGRASMDDSVEIVGQVTSEADVDTAKEAHREVCAARSKDFLGSRRVVNIYTHGRRCRTDAVVPWWYSGTVRVYRRAPELS